jgi:hypothetical protein
MDLIVIGPKGMTVVEEYFFGSVAKEVLRYTVMTTPHEKRKQKQQHQKCLVWFSILLCFRLPKNSADNINKKIIIS